MNYDSVFKFKNIAIIRNEFEIKKVDNLFRTFFENLCHKRNSTKRFWRIINFIVPSNLPTHIHTPYYLFIVLRT